MKAAWIAVALAAIGGTSIGACVGDEPAASTNDGGTELACTTGGQCANGKCVDGFCCDSDCTGQCQACNVSDHEGTCTPVTGKPHHATCNGDSDGICAGTCDGTNVDSCTYPTVTCGTTTASCAAGVAQLPAACANGTCGQAGTQTCALGCFQSGCLGVAQLAAAPNTACALLTDGNVRCWGDNSTGALGLGSITPAQVPTPTPATSLAGKTIKMLGATPGAVCAVLGDGSVQCWGDNFSGEAGTSTNAGSSTMPVLTPTTVADGANPLAGATFISSGSGARFCAIVTGGAIKCWGDNSNGALGAGIPSSATYSATGPTSYSFAPVDVCAPGSTTTPCTPATGATFVAVGDRFTCAVISGQVACWGNNGFANLAFTDPAGPSPDHAFPILVPGVSATNVTAGNGTACAANADGGATCWGSDDNGLIGNGTTSGTGVPTPTAVCTSADCSTLLGGVTAVSTSDNFVCAIASGAVKCWGSNSAGELGDGTSTSMQTFSATSAIASGAVQIAAAGQTSFAVVVNGAERDVECWGVNDQQQCGDGADAGATHNTPVSPKW